MDSTTQSSPSPVDHLAVLVHGLWGNPVHLDYLRDTLREQHPGENLHILVAKSNGNNFTYDGVEVCGERVTNEVEQTIRELEQHGAKIRKISIVGYSLGGLVARYAVGLLYKNGVFDDIEPVNFTTFATPHLGIRTPKLGYRSYLYNVMGSRTLSTSGQQMFLIDNFRETGRPLLSILADKNSIFMNGLRLFRNRSLYANTTNDRSVPYFTAGISKTDPFVDLDKVDVNYLPGQKEPVILDSKKPVSVRKAKLKELTTNERWTLLSEQTRKTLPFYALLFTLLPIALPAFMVNAMYQTYKSTQRIRLHESGQAGISLGRYRIPLLDDVQAVHDRVYERLAEQSGEDYLPTPPPESTQHYADRSSTSLSSVEAMKAFADAESQKDKGDFPTLALTPDQFAMIDNLDSLGFEKFPAHIQKHRHTHAAIVVRMDKVGFEEGKVVVNHWAKRFEV